MNDIEKKIDEWWTGTFLRLINEGKFDELVESYFTHDAVVMPPNADSVVGKQAILSWLKQLFAPLYGLTVEIERDSVECTVTGDYAIHIEEGAFVAKGRDGQRLLVLPRKYLHVFRNDGGEWKLNKYIWNEGVKEEAA